MLLGMSSSNPDGWMLEEIAIERFSEAASITRNSTSAASVETGRPDRRRDRQGVLLADPTGEQARTISPLRETEARSASRRSRDDVTRARVPSCRCPIAPQARGSGVRRTQRFATFLASWRRHERVAREAPGAGFVVEHHPGYLLVEKVGDAASVAEELDPRR